MDFPFGKPVNRRQEPDLLPVEGRPNWWKNKQGVERYVEPPKPEPDWPLTADEE
jgi:hypothetical protein